MALYLFMFAVHALVCRVTIRKASLSLRSIFLWGILFRLVLMTSVPILEDDYYRYLWDGYSTKSGVSPYASSPLDVARAVSASSTELTSTTVDSALVDSVRKSPVLLNILRRVNHPEEKTIYPPVAQFFFATIWVGAPDNITIESLRWRLRLAYLLLDCVTFFVCAALLKRSKKAIGLIILYWWNPIVMREIFNALHVDLLPAMLVVIALALWLRGGRFSAALGFAAAIFTKLYALVIAAALFDRTRRYGWFLLALGAICGVMALAMALTVGVVPGGLAAYSSAWEMHSFLYRILIAVLGASPFEAYARVAAAALCALGYGLCLLAIHCRQRVCLIDRVGMAIALIPLFSPAAFPWYAIWFIPFLPFMHWRIWIAVPPCLAVYYLRFWALYSDPSITLGAHAFTGAEVFDYLVSPAAYGLLIIWVLVSAKKMESRGNCQ
jgi:hypothetical protein